MVLRGRLEWRAEVPSADLVRIKPGMKVAVAPAGTVGATGALNTEGNTRLTGKVRMVGPTVEAATRNGLVYVDLPPSPAARAGMFASGEFELSSSSGLTVPQSAVMLRDGFSYVYRVGPDNKVTELKVVLGRRLGDRVEITKGVEGSMRLVASGVGFLGDGDTVRVVDAPAASAPAGTAVANARAVSTVK